MEKNKNEPRKHTKKNYFLPREYGEAHGDNWGNHRASFEVFQELGYCFLEKAYQRAMRMELGPGGLNTEIESDIQFQYKTKLLVITRQTF